MADADRTEPAPAAAPTEPLPSPWGDVIEHCFADLLALFFPVAHAGIDWRCKPEFLDDVLRSLVPANELGRRLADKLVRVRHEDGQDVLVLIHVEAHTQPADEFARSLFHLNAKMFGETELQAVTLAILADDDPDWRPTGFEDMWHGCGLEFRFPMAKLLDYRRDRAALETSDNPVAIAVLAHLTAVEACADEPARLAAKVDLVRRIRERGFAHGDVLYRFVDWMLELSEPRQQEFLAATRAASPVQRRTRS